MIPSAIPNLPASLTGAALNLGDRRGETIAALCDLARDAYDRDDIPLADLLLVVAKRILRVDQKQQRTIDACELDLAHLDPAYTAHHEPSHHERQQP